MQNYFRLKETLQLNKMTLRNRLSGSWDGRRGYLHILKASFHKLLKFPHSSVGKEFTCNAGDPSSVPESGRSPGEGKDYPLQYSGLENSKNCIVHAFTFKVSFHKLLKYVVDKAGRHHLTK